MTVPKILRVVQEGIEFFTIAPSGECAVSIRGLARMCGVSHTAIEKLLIALGNQTAPKMLETLYGQDFYLATNIVRRGKQIKPIRAKIASNIIRYYDQQGNEAAKNSLNAFLEIGFDSYVQGVTGYLPAKYGESSLEARHQITRLVREPDPWKRMYSKETCDRIRSWYFPRDFFWKFAYKWMTADEISFLNKHNPVLPSDSQRINRIFQHLSPQTRDRLSPEIHTLCTLIESSTSRQDFETRYSRIRGLDQMELFNA
jgi:hypothetical protein